MDPSHISDGWDRNNTPLQDKVFHPTPREVNTEGTYYSPSDLSEETFLQNILLPDVVKLALI